MIAGISPTRTGPPIESGLLAGMPRGYATSLLLDFPKHFARRCGICLVIGVSEQAERSCANGQGIEGDPVPRLDVRLKVNREVRCPSDFHLSNPAFAYLVTSSIGAALAVLWKCSERKIDRIRKAGLLGNPVGRIGRTDLYSDQQRRDAEGAGRSSRPAPGRRSSMNTQRQKDDGAFLRQWTIPEKDRFVCIEQYRRKQEQENRDGRS
jgi:hypothetical protein